MTGVLLGSALMGRAAVGAEGFAVSSVAVEDLPNRLNGHGADLVAEVYEGGLSEGVADASLGVYEGGFSDPTLGTFSDMISNMSVLRTGVCQSFDRVRAY